LLALNGVKAYSPLALGHAMAQTRELGAQTHEFWMDFNEPMMRGSVGCVILMYPGWTDSRGIKEEYEFFKSIDLPVVFMDYPITEASLLKIKTILKQEYSDSVAG
jgi:hypothetical protein